MPSAKAVQLTMNRDGIRDFAAQELGLVTSRYVFAESREEAIAAAETVGLPCVVKPVMSSLGQGPEHRPDGRGAGRGLGLCRRQHARRPAARDRRGIHRLRQRDHPADRRDQGRRPVLRADRPSPGSGRLSRKLAAGGDPARARCSRRRTRRARWSRRSAATASSASNSSSPATTRSSPNSARARTTPAW